jgi:hypothetical protein
VKKAAVVNLDDDDWLAPPPLKPVAMAGICKDKTPHEPRYVYVVPCYEVSCC